MNYVSILGRISQGANMLARRILVLLAATTALAAGGTQGEAVPTGPGRITFVSTRDGSAQVYVMNADGSHVTQLTRPPGEYHAPVFSPDGRKIALVSAYNETPQVYIMNADGSQMTRLTSPPGANGTPTFSPDGRTIAFVSNRDGGHVQIYLMNIDGSRVTRLTSYKEGASSPSFSPDGRRIAFDANEDLNSQIYVTDRDGSHAVRLTAPPRVHHAPAFSPDGRSIAFVCQPEGGGSVQICVMNANGSHVRQLTRWPQPGQRIAMNANMFPHFSLDGRTIVFTSMRSGTEQIHLMNADGSGVVRLTNPPGENFGPTFGR